MILWAARRGPQEDQDALRAKRGISQVVTMSGNTLFSAIAPEHPDLTPVAELVQPMLNGLV